MKCNCKLVCSFECMCLIKTEVVLKFLTVAGIIASNTFNKNRSCIEITLYSSRSRGKTCLIKTEVVLKLISAHLKYELCTKFNKNRSCIEMEHFGCRTPKDLGLIKTEVVLKSALSAIENIVDISLIKTEVVLKCKFNMAKKYTNRV